jgi:hypothetical protein
MATPNKWTEEQIQYLKDNWEKSSAGILAKELGKTRNAVMSKVRSQGLPYKRLGLSSNERQLRNPRNTEKRRRTKRLKTFIGDINGDAKVPAIAKDRRIEYRSKRPRLETDHYPRFYMEGGCRWVHGEPKDMNYCDKQRVDKTPYCKDHLDEVMS